MTNRTVLVSVAFLFLCPVILAQKTDNTIDDWIKLLKHKDPLQRQTAAHAIGEMRFRAREAVPALVNALDDSDPRVRAEAADALGQIRSGSREAMSKLAEMVKNEKDVYVRAAAVLALGGIRSNPNDTIPVLIHALQDKEDLVRVHASRVCTRIGREGRPLLPTLLNLLDDPHIDVRRNARNAIQRIDSSKLPKNE